MVVTVVVVEGWVVELVDELVGLAPVWAPAPPPNRAMVATATPLTKSRGAISLRRGRIGLIGGRSALEEEDGRVQEDPNDVDEVPVVGDDLEHRPLARVAAGAGHAAEEAHHGHQAHEDVETVQAGHEEEQRR